MSKLKWFKHYNAASGGDTLGHFFANHDYECVALFWVLLEYLSRNDDEQRSGKASVDLSFLGREMNMKPSKIRRVLARFSLVPHQWNLTVTGEKLSYLVPKWSELQERRGKKKVNKIDEKPGEVRGKKKEVRGKSKEGVETPPPRYLVYGTLYKNKTGREPTWGKSAAVQLAKLDRLPDLDFERALGNFFNDNREYYRKQGYQLHCLVNDIDQHVLDKSAIPDPLIKFFEETLKAANNGV